jgi:hypothetical protein
LKISEITQVTGTTASSYQVTSVSFPSGYTINNTRILSCEIYNSNNAWISLGEYVGAGMGAGGDLFITHPDHSMYQNKPFRMVLMKVE